MGLIYAAIAAISWGIGDFLIQRSARKFGDWEALFFITLFGAIALYPFVHADIIHLTGYEWGILMLTSIIILFAALFDFDALRVGKISIVEPIYALEIPITITLAAFVIGERLTLIQWSFIAALIFGIYLVASKSPFTFSYKGAERGIFFALIATVGMGASNFLFGFASRETAPLMINWVTCVFMAITTLVYLLITSNAHKLWHHVRTHKLLVVGVGAADNLAWVAYASSTLYLPIGLATALTEIYIVLAAVLGMVFNHERLRAHQQLGFVVAIIAAVVLALSVV